MISIDEFGDSLIEEVVDLRVFHGLRIRYIVQIFLLLLFILH